MPILLRTNVVRVLPIATIGVEHAHYLPRRSAQIAVRVRVKPMRGRGARKPTGPDKNGLR
jgi:hypothetical protein